MYDNILDYFISDSSFADKFEERELPAKSTLLSAGDISSRFYYVRRGAVRLWFNDDGRDITLQFFFEGRVVASIESLMNESPSLFSIETIEPTTVLVCDKEVVFSALEGDSGLKECFYGLVFSRFSNYLHLFLSRIRDTPQVRYEKLIEEHPEILERVPQCYIASYLGITSVSLSRIRGRR